MNFQKFCSIRETEDSSIKTRKRLDIAIFLKLLQKEVPDNKEVKKILTRFKSEAGGLYLIEIEYLNTVPETEVAYIKFYRYKAKYRKEWKQKVAKFEAVTYGKSKLTKPILSNLQKFAHIHDTIVKSEPFKLNYREIKVREDLYLREIGSTELLERIQELSEADKKELEKDPIMNGYPDFNSKRQPIPLRINLSLLESMLEPQYIINKQ